MKRRDIERQLEQYRDRIRTIGEGNGVHFYEFGRDRMQQMLVEYDAYVAERGLDPEETMLIWCNGGSCSGITQITPADMPPPSQPAGLKVGQGWYQVVTLPCAACGGSVTFSVCHEGQAA